MKQLFYRYRLKIEMDAPVTGHSFTLRCTPQSDARQQITPLTQHIAPADFISPSRDSWGNALLYGTCRGPHTRFEVELSGRALTGLADCVPSLDPCRDHIFGLPTPLTAADPALRRFVQALALHGDPLEQAGQAAAAVHAALRYAPGQTSIRTTASQALAAGCGVCQDYAHLLLAVLRCQGIPCRYVVGMLPGEGKSHAWAEVLYKGFWYGFDPTSDRRVRDEHIKLSHGRDFEDCRINRGLFCGSARQNTAVSVVVTEIG